jgi:hypothetical protein
MVMYSVPFIVSLRNVAVIVYRGGSDIDYKMSVLVDTIHYTLSKTFICVDTLVKSYVSYCLSVRHVMSGGN